MGYILIYAKFSSWQTIIKTLLNETHPWSPNVRQIEKSTDFTTDKTDSAKIEKSFEVCVAIIGDLDIFLIFVRLNFYRD